MRGRQISCVTIILRQNDLLLIPAPASEIVEPATASQKRGPADATTRSEREAGHEQERPARGAVGTQELAGPGIEAAQKGGKENQGGEASHGHVSHGRVPYRRHLHLIGAYLTGVHLMGVYSRSPTLQTVVQWSICSRSELQITSFCANRIPVARRSRGFLVRSDSKLEPADSPALAAFDIKADRKSKFLVSLLAIATVYRTIANVCLQSELTKGGVD